MSIPLGNCVCNKCGVKKDNTKFPYMKSRLDSYGFYTRNNATCKKCIAENNKIVNILKKNHPRPEEGYQCECCNKHILETKDMMLDHDHKTNEFRGWLCRKCNTGIGNLGDDEEGLLRALEYLRKNKPKPKYKLVKYMKNGVCVRTKRFRIN